MLVRLSYFLIVFETCSQRVCSTAVAAVIHYYILLYCYVYTEFKSLSTQNNILF